MALPISGEPDLGQKSELEGLTKALVASPPLINATPSKLRSELPVTKLETNVPTLPEVFNAVLLGE